MSEQPVVLYVENESEEGNTHHFLTEEEAVDIAIEKKRIVAYYF